MATYFNWPGVGEIDLDGVLREDAEASAKEQEQAAALAHLRSIFPGTDEEWERHLQELDEATERDRLRRSQSRYR